VIYVSETNVYDQAHLLASAVKSSREYADFRLAAARLKGEKSALEIMRDYRGRQFELQSRLLQGQEISDEEQDRFAQLSEVIAGHAVITEFLRAEYGLSRLLGDIQKILSDAVEVDLGGDGEAEDKA
jgi:cell fate (sporulation/competence/biofilm development) regulator YlbF (YheA/YmcA/DUF963 family)